MPYGDKVVDNLLEQEGFEPAEGKKGATFYSGGIKLYSIFADSDKPVVHVAAGAASKFISKIANEAAEAAEDASYKKGIIEKVEV